MGVSVFSATAALQDVFGGEGPMTIGRARFVTFQLTGRPSSESAVILQWPSA